MTTLSASELDELIERTEEQCKNQRCIDSHNVKTLLETLRQKIEAEQSLLRAIANSAELLGQALDRLDVPEKLLDDLGVGKMSETMFTPGPWTAWFCGTVRSAWLEVETTDEKTKICKLKGQANANLIAAAPDMYEALEMAILEYGKPGGPWNVPSSPGTWIDKAKAALKKARGEL